MILLPLVYYYYFYTILVVRSTTVHEGLIIHLCACPCVCRHASEACAASGPTQAEHGDESIIVDGWQIVQLFALPACINVLMYQRYLQFTIVHRVYWVSKFFVIWKNYYGDALVNCLTALRSSGFRESMLITQKSAEIIWTSVMTVYYRNVAMLFITRRPDSILQISDFLVRYW